MILTLKLFLPDGVPASLPFEYQYPFAAVIYKMLNNADSEYAYNLHTHGHEGHKFKLFTFSDIRARFIPENGRMKIQSNTVELTLCFHVEKTALNFVLGLLGRQEFTIFDPGGSVRFVIQDVRNNSEQISEDLVSCMVEPISPIVCGERLPWEKHTQYKHPVTDPDYVKCLLYMWFQRYQAVYNLTPEQIRDIGDQVKIEIITNGDPRRRMVTIHKGDPSEVRMRGYDGFRLKLTAPGKMIDLALNTGLGLNNTQGCGCLKFLYFINGNKDNHNRPAVAYTQNR